MFWMNLKHISKLIWDVVVKLLKRPRPHVTLGKVATLVVVTLTFVIMTLLALSSCALEALPYVNRLIII